MTWAKLDDRLWADPRSEAAGLEAMGLWTFALSWMGAYGTNGVIPKDRVRRFAGRSGHWLAERLVKAGWWTKVEGDAYQLLGWETYLLENIGSNLPANLGRTSREGQANVSRKSGEHIHEPPPVRENDGPRESRGETPRAPARPDPDPSRPDPGREEEENKNNVKEAAPDPAGRTAPALPGFEALVAEEAPPKPLPANSKAAATETEIKIFEAFLLGRKWRRVAKGPKPMLDAARLKVVRARLAEGFPADDLAAAAGGIWLSEWHFSEGQCRFDLALRNSEQIERFAALHHAKLDEQADKNRGEEEPEEENPFAAPHEPLTAEELADPAVQSFLAKFGKREEVACG